MVVRNIVKKVMWVGRATVFLVGLSVILAVVLGVATMAFAANGDAWRLGRANVATHITTLGGKLGVNGPMVRLINNDSGTDDTALDLKVQSGEPPMKVNSSAKVANLNADQLDGIDSTGFIQGKGHVYHGRDSSTPPVAGKTILNVPGFGNLNMSCFLDNQNQTIYALGWENTSGQTQEAWWFNKDGVGYKDLSVNGDTVIAPFTRSDYVVILQVGTGGRTATITAGGHAGTSGCNFSAQAVAQID